jgi:hypothetical protein
MSTQALLFLALQASVFLTVLAVGMRIEPADLTSLLSRPGRLARSPFALIVLARAIAISVCKTFSLHPAVVVHPRLLARFDGTKGQWRIEPGRYNVALSRSAGEPVKTGRAELEGRLFGG